MSESDYKFNFYLIDDASQLVFGFESRNEADFYCDVLGDKYRVLSYENAKRFNINPNNIDNWSDDVPKILEPLLEN